MKKFSAFILLLLAATGVKAQFLVTTVTQAACNNNGSASTTITGSYTAPITLVYYQYGNQAYDTFAVHSNVTTLPDVITGLPSGNYYIFGTDATGQTLDSGAFYIPSTYQLNVATVHAHCPTPGTSTVTPIGGTSPFTYAWTNSGGVSISTTNSITAQAGPYGVTVTDANGCITTGSAYIEDTFHINASITNIPANCTNGAAIITSATGGTAPYTYLWSNGSTSNSITNLVKGSYYVTITDANGCHSANSTYIQQAVTIGVNPVSTPATCLQYDGSVTTFGSGGVPPYTYNYSNGFSGQTLTGVPAGSYQVTVTDANGCTGTGYPYIPASTPITATNATTPSACTTATGGAVLTIAGGQPGYTVQWNTYPAQTSPTLSNVLSGNYFFNITDANGCVQSGSVFVPPVNVVSAIIHASNTYCSSATGTATVSGTNGGTAPYSYAWSTGSTNAAITGLAAGGYSVTVTDVMGCHKMFGVNIDTYSPVSLGANTTPASCIFNANGSVTVNAAGGTAPYTYSWSGGGSLIGNTASGLSAGNYQASVTDMNGCTARAYPYVDYDHSDSSCFCTLTGIVYDDTNGNCVQDAGENGIEHIGINCSGRGTAYTDASGHYYFQVPTGNYTLSENVQYYYPLAPCQNNSVAVTTVAASGCTQTVDFANVINPIHDVSITRWNWDVARPGFPYTQILLVSNNGSVAETTAVANATNDGQLGSANYSLGGIFLGTGNQYNANNISLLPGETTMFNADYMVPTNIPLNTGVVFQDTVAYTTPVANWLNDYSPWNNVNYFLTYTTGSYDPNSIQVSPQGATAAGNIPSKDSILTYMVHFQNTGTYYAQNIVVKTKLDANLDWYTLRPQYSSFPSSVSMDENGVLTHTFSNINLQPKAWSEDGSQGMFTFTVHLKNGLPAGTTFSNKADIYFDFNAPVATNSTLNTLLDPTAISNTVLNKASFAIFPNPTTGNFTASVTATGNATAELKVLDLSGRTLKSQYVTLTTGTQTIPVAMGSVASGVYFVTLTQGGVTTTQKLIVGK